MSWEDPFNLSLGVDSPAAAEPVTAGNAWQDFKHQFQASWNFSDHVDSNFGFEADLSDMMDENDDRISSVNPDYKPIKFLSSTDISVIASQYTASDLAPYASAEQRAATLSRFKAYDAQLQQMQKQYPGEAWTFQDMFNTIKGQREKFVADKAQADQGSGFAGTVGGFLGSGAAQFDAVRNPIPFATLFAGGIGKTAAIRIASEAGFFGASQVASDLLFTQPHHAAFGEPDVNIPEDALWAAGFGAVARGLHEGAAPAFRALESKIAPGRQFARALEEDVGRFNPSAEAFDLTNPTGRAGAALYEHDTAMREVNPYGDSDEGVARFLRDLDQMDESFSTGVATPEATPREPGDIRSAEVDRGLLKAEAPEVFGRLEVAEQKLDALTGVSNDIEGALNNRGVGDVAATFLDSDTADLIKSLENDLNDTKTPPASRVAAERQLNSIVETIGPERFQQAANDSAIKPKNELRGARKAEKAARQEFNAVAREAFDEIDRIKSRKAAEALVQHTEAVKAAEPMTKGDGPQPLTPESAEAAVKSTEAVHEELPKLVEAEAEKAKVVLAPASKEQTLTSSSVIKQTTINGEVDANVAKEILTKAADDGLKAGQTVTFTIEGKKVNIIGEGLVDDKGQKWGTAAFLFPKPGKENLLEIAGKGHEAYSLPNGDKVDLDFSVELEDGSHSTVRELLSDLQDEDVMLAAMKVCSI